MSSPRKRKPCFTNAEKLQLIHSIKRRSLLWDVLDLYHRDYDKVQAAWKAVSGEVKRPVPHCKEAWSSLRESYRYHFKRDCGKFQHLDGEDFDPLLATKQIDWRFAEAMSFMPQPAIKRPRPSSPTVLNEADGEDEAGEDDEVADWMTGSAEIPADALLTPESVENIKPDPKTRGKPRKSAASTSQESVVDMLSNFLKETRHCLEQPVSKNATVLAYWDTLLTGMSPQNSQRAVFKVTEFLQEIAKKEVENKRKMY
ncbi:uncharacterized protein LOC110187764 [Drosophila serrata]|uniref:uncharacterized protein LOC110187764 n=1 Tax=Drosophila serrata TaxID=7274 RepID=UPI000A1D006E|nr:uncharacterized protein LOC110187764 [Drosophila serrata]